jgi:hypothetical protein
MRTFSDEFEAILAQLHTEAGVAAGDARNRAAELARALAAVPLEPDESERMKLLTSIHATALLAAEIVAIKSRKASYKAFERGLLVALDVGLAALTKLPLPAASAAKA